MKLPIARFYVSSVLLYSFLFVVMSDVRDILVDVVFHLVNEDTSVDANIDPQGVGLDDEQEEDFRMSAIEEDNSPETLTRRKNKNNINESALFIATKSNITYIVMGILCIHPRALEKTDKEGMNILHVAILHRHIEIFDAVLKYEVLARRLLSATDKQGNSALHMVSQKRKSPSSEKMQSPALQLRDELRLFEKVKSACKNLVINRLNKEGKTAEELFADANVELHREAKEWVMRTTENCTILSVFIATVAFAAIFTIPGGPNQNTGIPILHSKPFFLVFILADVMSIASALISVGTFLSILTSSFLLEDFRTYLFKKLVLGIVCLVLSVSMMAVAFGATIVLMMSHTRENVHWSAVAFLPVPIFFLSYSPLRSAALTAVKPYVVNPILAVVCVLFIVVDCVFFFRFLLPYRGLLRIVERVGCNVNKACTKPIRHICRKIPFTKSPQPPRDECSDFADNGSNCPL